MIRRKKIVKYLLLTFSILTIVYFELNKTTSIFVIQTGHFDLVSILDINDMNKKTSDRIRLMFHGLCLSSSKDKRLITVYCNPNTDPKFILSPSGKLIFGDSGHCISRGTLNNVKLTFQICDDAISFTIVNNSYLQLIDNNSDYKCLTPVAGKEGHKKGARNPKHGDELQLMDNCDDVALRVYVMDERIFQIDRKALVSHLHNSGDTCHYAWCHLNLRLAPVVRAPSNQMERCENYSECVTIVTKTARRPLLVLRMANSIREVKGYDLPIIAFDDGPYEYDEGIRKQIEQFPLLEYNIGDNEDLGISLGRNLALSKVKTKYSLFIDDDNIFTNNTMLETAVKILDTTDASVVGGKYSFYKEYSGFMEFDVYGDTKLAQLKLYKGSCTKANVTVPGFSTCVSCDLTSNIFLSKTSDIQEVGGWSPELKTMEHKDIFLKLKASGKKVVYCPNFQVINRKATAGTKFSPKEYVDKRVRRASQMQRLFCNRWNIYKVQENPRKDFNFTKLLLEVKTELT